MWCLLCKTPGNTTSSPAMVSRSEAVQGAGREGLARGMGAFRGDGYGHHLNQCGFMGNVCYVSALVKFRTSNTKAPLKSLMLEREQAGPDWKAVTGAVGEADVSCGLRGLCLAGLCAQGPSSTRSHGMKDRM